MKTREEALNYGLSFPNTYMEMPFHDPNWQLVRVKGSKKAFLWTYEKDGCLHLNVKTDPAWRDFWRSTFSSVIPAYHQNKDHWNTIILDGSIPDEDIRRMIAESYDLVTDSPTKRIYDHIPCYRVVNSKGELSGAFAFGGSNEQANRLRADGIEVTGNKVDLQKFGISL